MNTGQVIVAVLGGSGVIGAILSFFKLGKERDKLVVDAAQGLVTMSSAFAQQLKNDNAELRDRIDAQEEQLKALPALKEQVADLTLALRTERRRREDLEAELEGFRRRRPQL